MLTMVPEVQTDKQILEETSAQLKDARIMLRGQIAMLEEEVYKLEIREVAIAAAIEAMVQ